MSKNTLAWVALVITTVVWASSLIFAKMVYADGMTPIIFVALRYTIASPFLIALVRLTRSSSTSTEVIKSKWKILFIAGITGPFLSQIFQYIGLNLTTAGETLLLLNLTPVFAVIIAVPLLKERITPEKLGGLILATLGATMIIIGGNTIDYGVDTIRLLGDGIIIVSTILFAINGIAGKIAVSSIDAISVTLYSTLFAIPFIWLSAGIMGDLHVLFELSFETWVIMFWVAIVNTVLGFILYYQSMKHIEASVVQIGLSLIAVWGVIMAVSILGESTSIIQILGGALTIVGVILVQRMQNTSNNTHKATDMLVDSA